MSKSIYVIGSLRNEKIPEVAKSFRDIGLDAFDDWYAAGPEADDYWKSYEVGKGSSYAEALAGYAAQHVFHFDKHHLDRCDYAVLVLPAGKSGHLELGYFLGTGKQGYILLDGEDTRFDVMYNFATKVFSNKEEMIEYFRNQERPRESESSTPRKTFPLSPLRSNEMLYPWSPQVQRNKYEAELEKYRRYCGTLRGRSISALDT